MDLPEKVENLSFNSENIQKKREDYIDWREYFMAIAFLAAKRSKDPSYQVGACVVNKDNKIVGIGYNGLPIGCSDDDFPWGKNTPSPLDSKFLYVCHAEMNAILNKNSADLKNCTIYVGLFPCNECAKIIIQSGITEVIYLSDEKAHKPMYIASKKMFDAAGVTYWQFIPKHDTIEIKFTGIDWNKMTPSK
ncbi:deoxycytidylate deaminase [Nymphalis io]|uniref:deoxycytidylate deaminase n=1 Tax=Inachis io TaxID=171585 RepID=UPI002169AA1C|nr:deoxycytidylate deaminase [Nymphalis io]